MNPRNALAVLAMGIAIFGASLGGIACSSDDDDDASPTATAAVTDATTREVQEAIRATAAAWNAKDVARFAAGWTTEGLLGSFGEAGATADEVIAAMPEFIGSEELANFDFLETTIEGESATVDVQYTVGVALDRSIFTMVRQGGTWLISEEDNDVAIKIPDDATTIDIGLTEFTFNVSTDEIANAESTIVMVSTNTGLQDHEIGLIRVDEGVDVLTTLQTFVPQGPEDPEGLTFLGGDYVSVGESSTIAFHEPLEPGRYALICMLPDTNEGEDGTPHALKGMLTEFTVVE